MSRHTAHLVVRLGAGAVQAQRHRLEALLTPSAQGGVREQGRYRRSHGHRHTAPAGVGDEFNDVRSLETVAAGEDKNRTGSTHGGQFVYECATFGVGKFVAIRFRLRPRATGKTREIASLGRLPKDQQWSIVELPTRGHPTDD